MLRLACRETLFPARAVGPSATQPSSLFLPDGSLFRRKNSLFRWVGNLRLLLRDGTLVAVSGWAETTIFEKFPVKFPVSKGIRAEQGATRTAAPAKIFRYHYFT
jgi:hypothetical protein